MTTGSGSKASGAVEGAANGANMLQSLNSAQTKPTSTANIGSPAQTAKLGSNASAAAQQRTVPPCASGDCREQAKDGGKKGPFDLDLLAPGDRAYAPSMTYVRTPGTANDFIAIGHGSERWGTYVTDEVHNKDLNAAALTARIIGSKKFQEHPREVMLMICFSGKSLSSLAAQVSKDLWDQGYHEPVSGPSMHGNIGGGRYWQDPGGRQRTFMDGKEVLGPKPPDQTGGPCSFIER